jgi:hypothetical protein
MSQSQANPTKEKRNLQQIFAQPNPASLPVKVAITAEVLVVGEGASPVDKINVVLQPDDPQQLGASRIYDLLGFAPIAYWKRSRTLAAAVQNGWLYVNPDIGHNTQDSITQQEEECCGIPRPENAQTGDLLVFNGGQWTNLNPGTAGFVLTSNGPFSLPGFQAGGGGGSGGDSVDLTGQTTTGLTSGDIAYISSTNTWSKARSDGSILEAEARGASTGFVGQMRSLGRINDAKFTIVGGSPIAGHPVYLAASTDDGGLGSGKATATPPVVGNLIQLGVCLDATNYATLGTAVIWFDPMMSIQL